METLDYEKDLMRAMYTAVSTKYKMGGCYTNTTPPKDRKSKAKRRAQKHARKQTKKHN